MQDKKVWFADVIRGIEECRSILIVNYRDMVKELRELIPEAEDDQSVSHDPENDDE